MRLKLPELQDDDTDAHEFRANDLTEGCDDIERVFSYQGLPHLSEIVRADFISRFTNGPLDRHIGIEKTHDLIARKYCWPTLRHNFEEYVKGCDVCLASKVGRRKKQ